MNMLMKTNDIIVCNLDVVFVLIFFFFFSSRRRHTRSKRDWSSDVCSSDLLRKADHTFAEFRGAGGDRDGECTAYHRNARGRSEERRVGKECRSRWWAEK